MIYRTTPEWRERGFLIRTGARSHARNQFGTALFNRDQVRKVNNAVMYIPRGATVIYI